MKEILDAAQALFEEMRDVRRHLHAHPELGTHELETQKYIMDFLAREGIAHEKCADTGVVAIIHGEPGGKVVALRADIDALPIEETADKPYRSQNKGVMHACGHDLHTAINLGAAKLLNSRRGTFRGTVKLFFQPAEESVGGAQRMVEQGCMENPRVDAVIGLHVMPYLDYNQIEIRNGPLNASTDSVKLTVKGKRGHGAYPDRCVDAIVIAANIITALQTAVSRSVSPLDSAVFTAGTIKGGDAGNIVAEKVEIKGTIRASRFAVRELMLARVREIAEGVARALGGECDVELSEGYLPLVNDGAVLDVIEQAAAELLGCENILHKESMSMGGEDFSFFNQNVPGAFYHLGCREQGREEYFLHTAEFDADERCIVTGIALEALAAIKLMEGR